MRKLFLFSCLFLLSFSVVAQTTSVQNDAEIATLINAQNYFELFKKHKQYQGNLSPLISLLAQINIAQHFNQEKRGVYLIDSLLTHYSEHLTQGHIWGYEHIKAVLLYNTEQYKELYNYSSALLEKYKNNGNVNYNAAFSYYQDRSKPLQNIPSSEIVRPSKDCYVPIIPYKNQRIHISVKVNQISLSDCIFDTGAPFSIFHHSAVENASLKIIGDTISVHNPMHGIIKLSLAILDSLTIGEISFKNLLIGVVCPNQKFIEAPGIIGLREMKTLNKVIFTPTNLIFPYHTSKNLDVIPNMILKNNEPYIRVKHEQQELDMFFDTGSDANFLSSKLFQVDSMNYIASNKLMLKIGNSDAPILFRLETQRSVLKLGAGLLGTPFVHNFKKVTFDLLNMQLQTDSFVGYISLEDYICDENYFGLSNCEEKHNLSGKRKYFMKYLIYSGKNKPEQTISLIDTLLNDYPLETDNPTLFLMHNMYKAGALFDIGQYAKAYEVVKEAAKKMPEVPAGVQRLINRNRVTAQCPPVEIRFTSPSKPIRLSKQTEDGLVIPLQINSKKEKAIIDLGNPFCEISETYVSKLNIKIIADSIMRQDQLIKMGIVDYLKIGNVIASNVIFYILPEKESRIVLGNSLLRLIPQISIKPNKEVILHKERVEQTDADSLPLRLQNYFLMTQLKLNGNPITFDINNKSGVYLDNIFHSKEQLYLGKNMIDSSEVQVKDIATSGNGIRGEIGLSDLIKQRKEIVFDFQEMKIYFP